MSSYRQQMSPSAHLSSLRGQVLFIVCPSASGPLLPREQNIENELH